MNQSTNEQTFEHFENIRSHMFADYGQSHQMAIDWLREFSLRDVDHLDPDRRCDVIFAIGYLQGVADSEDTSILSLIERITDP